MRNTTAIAIAVAAVLAACGGANKNANDANDANLLEGTSKGSAPSTTAAGAQAANDLEEGKQALQAKNYTAARDAFARVLAKKPEDAEANFYIAETYEKLGDKEHAELYYRKVLELKKDNVDAAANLAALLDDQNRFEDAIAVCKALLAQDPGDKPGVDLVHLNYARALGWPAQQGGPPRDGAGAQREYEAAIKQSPNNPDFHIAYASYLGVVAKKPDAARAELQKAATLANDDAGILVQIARIYTTMHDTTSCVQTYDKVIAKTDVADARVGRGLCKFAAKDAAGAETDFRAATALDQKNAMALYWLGRVLEQKSDWKGALQAYEDAQSADPNGQWSKPANEHAAVVRPKAH